VVSATSTDETVPRADPGLPFGISLSDALKDIIIDDQTKQSPRKEDDPALVTAMLDVTTEAVPTSAASDAEISRPASLAAQSALKLRRPVAIRPRNAPKPQVAVSS
jgi:hypothetical protein